MKSADMASMQSRTFTKIGALVAVGIVFVLPPLASHPTLARTEVELAGTSAPVPNGGRRGMAKHATPTLASLVTSPVETPRFVAPAGIASSAGSGLDLARSVVPIAVTDVNLVSVATISTPASFSFGFVILTGMIAFLRWRREKLHALRGLH